MMASSAYSRDMTTNCLDLLQRCAQHGFSSFNTYDQQRLLDGPLRGYAERGVSVKRMVDTITDMLIQEDCRFLLALMEF
jgi:hypothetical protein